MEKKENVETTEEKCTCEKCTKKGNSFFTTFIIIILMATVGVLGWIIGASKVANMSESARKENSGVSKTVEKQTAKEETTKEETTKEDDATQKVKDEIKPLDLNNSLNSTGITYSDSKQLIEGDEVTGISVKRNENSVKLVIDWPKFGPHSGATAWSNEAIEYEISDLSGNVKKAVVAGIGQDITGAKIFYLMEDGTVEYTDIFTRNYDKKGTLYFNVNYTYEKDSNGRITGEHFASQGKVNGVKDVVELYSVSAIPTGSMIGAYGTTLAATKDGSFYDLGKAINK